MRRRYEVLRREMCVYKGIGESLNTYEAHIREETKIENKPKESSFSFLSLNHVLHVKIS